MDSEIMDKDFLDKELIRYILVFAVLPGIVGGAVLSVISYIAYNWGLYAYLPNIQ